MFPKKNRLEKKSFHFLFKNGRKKNFINFTLIYFKNNYFKENKFGIIVSSAVSKKAILRNKLKRRTKVIVFNLSKKINTPKGIIIILKKQSSNLSFNELEKEIKDAFYKIPFLIN